MRKYITLVNYPVIEVINSHCSKHHSKKFNRQFILNQNKVYMVNYSEPHCHLQQIITKHITSCTFILNNPVLLRRDYLLYEETEQVPHQQTQHLQRMSM